MEEVHSHPPRERPGTGIDDTVVMYNRCCANTHKMSRSLHTCICMHATTYRYVHVAHVLADTSQRAELLNVIQDLYVLVLLLLLLQYYV